MLFVLTLIHNLAKLEGKSNVRSDHLNETSAGERNGNCTVIRFVSTIANFGICTVVGLNETLIEAKICSFKRPKCVV
jgi:hypothetical protein